MYQIHPLGEKDLHHYATFLRDIQTQHWSLSSNAFQRQPNSECLPSCEEIIENWSNLEHSVIYLLTDVTHVSRFCHAEEADRLTKHLIPLK